MSALQHLPIHASGIAVTALAQSEPISSCSLGQGWSRYTVFYWGCYGVQKWTWQSVQSWLTISRLGMGNCSLLWLLHRTYVSPILVQPDNVVRPTKGPWKLVSLGRVDCWLIQEHSVPDSEGQYMMTLVTLLPVLHFTYMHVTEQLLKLRWAPTPLLPC